MRLQWKALWNSWPERRKKGVLLGSLTGVVALGLCVVLVAVLLAGRPGTLPTGPVETESQLSGDGASDAPAPPSEENAGTTSTTKGVSGTSGRTQADSSTTTPVSSQVTWPLNNKGELVFKEPQSAKAGDLVDKAMVLKSKIPNTAIPELTPHILLTGGRYYLSVPTGHTVTIPFAEGARPQDLFTSIFALEDKKAWLSCDNMAKTGAGMMGGQYTPANEFNADASWANGYPYWARSYHTTFDMTEVTIDGVKYILSLNTGENKNEKFADGRKLMNSIMKKRVYGEQEYSGVRQTENGILYDDYPPSYYCFTSMSVIPSKDFRQGLRVDETKYDKGPIVWPENGFIDANDNRQTNGLRHPSMYVDNEYVYVFYVDNDRVHVARSPLSAKGEPSSFRIYANGSFSKPSLPQGFDKNDRAFFTKGIGKADNLLGNVSTQRFAVAKVKGTDYYIGAEEYFTRWPASGLRFRLSKDLVHWGPPFEVPGAYVDDYAKGTLHFPVFYNKDFTSRYEIDLNEFYVMGTSGNSTGRSQAVAVKFRLELC